MAVVRRSSIYYMLAQTLQLAPSSTHTQHYAYPAYVVIERLNLHKVQPCYPSTLVHKSSVLIKLMHTEE